MLFVRSASLRKAEKSVKFMGQEIDMVLYEILDHKTARRDL